MADDRKQRLTETVTGAGWGSKLAPGDLDQALCGLAFPADGNVLVGPGTADDAGVYRIGADLALVQTVDFFTPMVDDPFDFGRIAAANALSDVYAMGGTPKTALNLVAFPIERLDRAVLRAALAGGIEILREAETVLIGGHSIEDREFKYGLAVTGFVHPDRVLTNRGLRPGDRLILTKPLGSGIICTAIKAGLAETRTIAAVTEVMAALNKSAARIVSSAAVSACTDITGFGLLGHLAEMVHGASVGVTIDSRSVPVLPEALEFAAIGLVPAGAHRNRTFRQSMIEAPPDFSPILRDVLFDPQTSGGLLVGVAERDAFALHRRLIDHGITQAAIIGHVHDHPQSTITLV